MTDALIDPNEIGTGPAPLLSTTFHGSTQSSKLSDGLEKTLFSPQLICFLVAQQESLQRISTSVRTETGRATSLTQALLDAHMQPAYSASDLNR